MALFGVSIDTIGAAGRLMSLIRGHNTDIDTRWQNIIVIGRLIKLEDFTPDGWRLI
ncbi:MAG: hypothetical protein IH914_03470 [candidate division Zixibacteria bacterium]|nr:hypothetical protein [candidate division Zixibacteria bacterium]